MLAAKSKASLRKQLRHQRRSLSPEAQHQAAYAIVPVCRQLLRPQQTKRIAVYLAMDGELDVMPLIQDCWLRGIEVYLPVLHPFKPTLLFARFEAHSKLYDNRFAIPEPIHGDMIRPWQLNAVLFPLVGFDERGGRLGMGGGFYDRTFAPVQRWPSRPHLYGIAHECQKVAKIPLESWDVKVDGIISDKRFYRARTQ